MKNLQSQFLLQTTAHRTMHSTLSNHHSATVRLFASPQSWIEGEAVRQLYATAGRWHMEQAASGHAAMLVSACANASALRSLPRPASVDVWFAKSVTCSTRKHLPHTKASRQWFMTSLMPDSYPSSRRSDRSSLTRHASLDGSVSTSPGRK